MVYTGRNYNYIIKRFKSDSRKKGYDNTTMRFLFTILLGFLFSNSFAQQRAYIGLSGDTLVTSNAIIKTSAKYDTIPTILSDSNIPSYKNVKDSTSWQSVMERGNYTSTSAHINHGSEALGLHADSIADHVYMSYYPDSSNPTDRHAYVGFHSNFSRDFHIAIQKAARRIKLTTNTGGVDITGDLSISNIPNSSNPSYLISLDQDNTLRKTGIGLVKDYINASDYGVNVDSLDNSPYIQDALNAAKNGTIKKVLLPYGVLPIQHTIYVPDSVELYGRGIGLTILLNTGATLDTLVPLRDVITPNEQKWLTMVATEKADDIYTDSTYGIKIHDLTIDWNNQPADLYSPCPLMISRTSFTDVYNVEIKDALPSDYDITTLKYGNNILFAFAYKCSLYNSRINSSDYESVSFWFLSKNISMHNNYLLANKPYTFNVQVHLAQSARPTNLRTVLQNRYGEEKPGPIFIYNNTFHLKSNIAHAATSHSSNGFYFRNNYIKYDTALHFPSWGVKPFDETENFELTGNVIDMRGYSWARYAPTVLMANTDQGNVGITKNGKINGNTVYITDTSSYTGTPFRTFATLIGGYTRKVENVQINNNTVKIDGYNNYPFSIFGVNGKNIQVSNNTVELTNPFTTIDTGASFLRTRGGENISISDNNIYGISGQGIIVDSPLINSTLTFNVFDSVVNRLQVNQGDIPLNIDGLNNKMAINAELLTVKSTYGDTAFNVQNPSGTNLFTVFNNGGIYPNFAPASGSNNYIQRSPVSPQVGNINISGEINNTVNQGAVPPFIFKYTNNATSGIYNSLFGGFYVYDGSSINLNGYIVATSNSFNYGTYLPNQFNVASASSNGLGFRAASSPIRFYTGNSDPDNSPWVGEFSSTGLKVIIPNVTTADSALYVEDGIIKRGLAGMTPTLLTSASSGDITTAYRVYSFTGTTTTWTLPSVANGTGFFFFIFNKGSGNITLNTNSGGNDIWEAGSLTNTKTILPGETFRIFCDGATFNLSN